VADRRIRGLRRSASHFGDTRRQVLAWRPRQDTVMGERHDHVCGARPVILSANVAASGFITAAPALWPGSPTCVRCVPAGAASTAQHGSSHLLARRRERVRPARQVGAFVTGTMAGHGSGQALGSPGPQPGQGRAQALIGETPGWAGEATPGSGWRYGLTHLECSASRDEWVIT